MKLLLKNYFSTLIFIFFIYFFYNSFDYYHSFFQGKYQLDFLPWVSFTIIGAFHFVIGAYTVLLLPFYYIHQEKGKALLIVEYFIKKIQNFSYKIQPQEKVAVLAWGVKMFFAPLMIFWILWHVFSLLSSYDILIKTGTQGIPFIDLFNNSIFWLCFNTIFFVDVFFFTCGYLFESPYLKNTIKSVEPTVFWWFVALACYPPFNSYTNIILKWYSNDFPQFQNVYLHIWFNVWILLLMAIYSWASFALGFKASNLTNRGIVKKGPYRYVRHPAYIAKNIAWWIGGFPALYWAFHANDFNLLTLVLFSLASWTGIYFLRALTEEWHLSQDKEYREYKKEVPYRFIPYIY